ncbi:CpsD/CapB family tyrosine-protein kinase [Lactobacillus reuteri]|uniref:CpsD/CapB family tyrosine-protein kinase n=1 Tax=Limosilactobacillus reuteri TaxID=1598 RepID=UPI00146F7F43|nr:CpsD/CapB family tyrosine-protein kinase [Limosilactobacillus reuteri]NMV53472.1 CpsD/CapB family tyrosine-protein kinase [Limosilactobacillus reuteri]NMV57905.1 CpsD/CapB family tyrosine-protein kinase [Limosilactobacillus reuteri]
MSFFHRRNENQSNATIHNGMQLITVMHPKSPISEQFRTLRTNINFMAIDHPIKTLALTSANVSEGKSTVTDNLAVVWAQKGQRVLLVDADLRRPILYRTFDLDNQQGLTTILTSRDHRIDLNKIIQPSGIENLSLLPSGPIPPNPAELLSSHRMQDFLAAAKKWYDMVIVDVPPMLEVTDTQVISHDLDAVVLVVKQGQTQKLGAKRAVELLKMAHANLLGYVMNDVVSDGSAGYGK